MPNAIFTSATHVDGIIDSNPPSLTPKNDLFNALSGVLLSLGSIVLYDSFTTANSISKVYEVTVNNLNNAHSKFYLHVKMDWTGLLDGVAFDVYMCETWDIPTHLGDFIRSGRVASGFNSPRTKVGDGNGGHTHIFYTFSHPEFKGINYFYDGIFWGTIGWVVPGSKPSAYNQATHLYAFLVDPISVRNLSNMRLYVPFRNPWNSPTLIVSSPQIVMSNLDSVSLSVPIIHGVPFYEDSIGALVGGLGPDFGMTSRSPVIAYQDILQSTVNSQKARPVMIPLLNGPGNFHSIVVNTDV